MKPKVSLLEGKVDFFTLYSTLKPYGTCRDDFRNLIVCVLVDNSRLKGMKECIHQPFAFPQPLSGLCSIRADVPGEKGTEGKPQ